MSRSLVLLLCLVSFLPAEELTSPEALQFFERSIRPLLAEHCYECHSARSKKLQAGLRLDSRQAILRGGESGPAIVPGDAAESLLFTAVDYESFEMPPQGKLSQREIDAVIDELLESFAVPCVHLDPEDRPGWVDVVLRGVGLPLSPPQMDIFSGPA